MKFRGINLKCIFILTSIYILMYECAHDKSQNYDAEGDIGKITYKRLLLIKRKSHIGAVNNIINMRKYDKQYKMVKLLIDKIFKVIIEAKANLLTLNYTLDQGFPENETIRDYFANIVENTMFFGDIVLRLPDITRQHLKTNDNFTELTRWSFNFIVDSQLFQPAEMKSLNLMAQEMKFVEADPNYENPYADSTKLKKAKEEMEKMRKLNGGTLKVKRIKKKRGPRLSVVGEL